MKISEARLTLYALISAIEADLRNTIITTVLPTFSDSSFMDSMLAESVKSKYVKDNPGMSPETNYKELVQYIDFQDAYKIIIQNKAMIPDSLYNQIKQVTDKLDSIAPIRNRVMHSRPLMYGDLPFVYGFAQDLSKNSIWETTEITLNYLESDPSFIATVNIPTLSVNYDEIFHNLPVPDFDETGFIGRRKDVSDVTKLLLGSTRVVSIIGEGGIGKSALLLKIAYDIVDLKDKCPFDIIIWVTSKTTILTSSGIEEIRYAISSFSGVLDYIANNMGAPKTGTLTDSIESILDYIKTFQTLLIFDNLETIISPEIREFLREAQLHAKIAITSRVGLGELEYPRHLEGLSENESVSLIRESAKMRNEEVLLKLSPNRLTDIAKKLHYNPLALKWFVNSVSAGKNPDEVIQNKDELLSYCLSNVFDKLDDISKSILETIMAARKALNEAEIIFFTEFYPLEIKKALIHLLSTSFVKRQVSTSRDSTDLTYAVTDFAREYLLKYHPIDKPFIDKIAQKRKELTMTVEETQRRNIHSEFSVNALEIRTPTERIAAKFLQEALRLSKKGNYEHAIAKVDEARNLAPSYFEIYRVAGFIKSLSGDILGAEDEYKTALELEPENPRLNYFMAGFLLRNADDVTQALQYMKLAHSYRPDSSEVKVELARCLIYQGYYDDGVCLLQELLLVPDLTVKLRKISINLLVGGYKRWAEKEYNINKDTKSALKYLLKAIDTFQLCVKWNIEDYKLISSLGYVVAFMINIIINKNLLHLKPYVIEICNRNRTYLMKSDFKGVIEEFVGENFTSIHKTDYIRTAERFTGSADRVGTTKAKGFVFLVIKSGRRFKLQKGDLLTPEDWDYITDGSLISFEVDHKTNNEAALNAFMDVKCDNLEVIGDICHSNGVIE